MNESTLSSRFWAKVKKTSSCWIWIGSSRGGGNPYGSFKIGQKNRQAHRVSWELTYGEIPDGLSVLHRCDVPLCVKPTHLFLGDQQVNVADRHAKERTVMPCTRGRLNGSAKMSEPKVRTLKKLRRRGWSYRRLSKRYKISVAQVGHIVTGEHWAHVQ